MAPKYYRLYCICFFTACLIVLLLQVEAHRRQTVLRESLRLGGFTAQQILKRVEPVAAVIAPPGADIRMIAEPLTGHPSAWAVTCLDGEDYFATLRLDAADGELLNMGVHETVVDDRPNLTDEPKAVRCRREWVGSLGPLIGGTGWRFDRATRGRPPVRDWIFQGKSGDRRLSLKIDPRNGRLLAVDLWRAQDRINPCRLPTRAASRDSQ